MVLHRGRHHQNLAGGRAHSQRKQVKKSKPLSTIRARALFWGNEANPPTEVESSEPGAENSRGQRIYRSSPPLSSKDKTISIIFLAHGHVEILRNSRNDVFLGAFDGL